ncbi:hypothetical protein BRE01_64890 [Brevibacillus reuszeri]|uniref:Transposase n=1 Tax=Brevibacillus reuszeri TaxID=54915 RepID=A0ABQ0TXZ6_9BACL|nr:hypothetical protein [Brevibacillus reuszeri]MED1861773.1 hypothetical protein [Brevibacillus reuszeri]GED72787.1 hypothetical protein BRE01_64890 [Brevibacillus reuszeri]
MIDSDLHFELFLPTICPQKDEKIYNVVKGAALKVVILQGFHEEKKQLEIERHVPHTHP